MATIPFDVPHSLGRDEARARLEASDMALREFRKQARVEAVRRDVESRLGGPVSPIVVPSLSSALKPEVGSTMQSLVMVQDHSGGRVGLSELTARIAADKARLSIMEKDALTRRSPELEVEAARMRAEVAALEEERARVGAPMSLDAATQGRR